MPGPAAATAPRSYVEVDAKAVRCETVRAIRGLVKPPKPTIEPVSCDPPRGALRDAMGVLCRLEQSLAAISHSLAVGVASTATGRRASP